MYIVDSSSLHSLIYESYFMNLKQKFVKIIDVFYIYSIHLFLLWNKNKKKTSVMTFTNHKKNKENFMLIFYICKVFLLPGKFRIRSSNILKFYTQYLVRYVLRPFNLFVIEYTTLFSFYVDICCLQVRSRTIGCIDLLLVKKTD